MKPAHQGKELVVQSSSEAITEQMNLTVTEWHYPQTAGQALLDRSALEQFSLSIGNTIEIDFPNGQIKSCEIIETYGNFSSV